MFSKRIIIIIELDLKFRMFMGEELIWVIVGWNNIDIRINMGIEIDLKFDFNVVFGEIDDTRVKRIIIPPTRAINRETLSHEFFFIMYMEILRKIEMMIIENNMLLEELIELFRKMRVNKIIRYIRMFIMISITNGIILIYKINVL